jgi:hypothetical protein
MLTDCESQFASRQPGLASVDLGTVTVDAAALSKCLAAYQQSATDCGENTLLAGCVGVFLGTKGSGEACSNVYTAHGHNGDVTEHRRHIARAQCVGLGVIRCPRLA